MLPHTHCKLGSNSLVHTPPFHLHMLPHTHCKLGFNLLPLFTCSSPHPALLYNSARSITHKHTHTHARAHTLTSQMRYVSSPVPLMRCGVLLPSALLFERGSVQIVTSLPHRLPTFIPAIGIEYCSSDLCCSSQ